MSGQDNHGETAAIIASHGGFIDILEVRSSRCCMPCRHTVELHPCFVFLRLVCSQLCLAWLGLLCKCSYSSEAVTGDAASFCNYLIIMVCVFNYWPANVNLHAAGSTGHGV